MFFVVRLISIPARHRSIDKSVHGQPSNPESRRRAPLRKLRKGFVSKGSTVAIVCNKIEIEETARLSVRCTSTTRTLT